MDCLDLLEGKGLGCDSTMSDRESGDEREQQEQPQVQGMNVAL